MKQGFGTSPEYDLAVRQRLWYLWCHTATWHTPDVLYAIYKAGQKGYKLEDLTLDNLIKFKGGAK
jgi:hypothetical protein